jgi:hypothetical protein
MEGNTRFYGFTEGDLKGYVEQNLSETTRLALEQAIPQYPELKQELIRRIHEHRALKHANALIWLAQERDKKLQPPDGSKFVKISIFFSLIFLAVWFGYGRFMQSNGATDSDTKSPHISTVQHALLEKGDRDIFGQNASNGHLNQALEYFRNKEYKKAEALFIPLRNAVQSDELEIYIAICRLHQGKYSESRQILYPLLADMNVNNKSFQSAVRWYLSLALIAESQPKYVETAQEYLEALANQQMYQPYVTEILSTLSVIRK